MSARCQCSSCYFTDSACTATSRLAEVRSELNGKGVGERGWIWALGEGMDEGE